METIEPNLIYREQSGAFLFLNCFRFTFSAAMEFSDFKTEPKKPYVRAVLKNTSVVF